MPTGMTPDQVAWFHAIMRGEGRDEGKLVQVNKQALMEIAEQIVDTVIRKNHDYGDAWQALGSVGAAARFVDKMFRIERLANGQEALVVSEKLDETVSDLVGYGLLIILKGLHQKYEEMPRG